MSLSLKIGLDREFNQRFGYKYNFFFPSETPGQRRGFYWFRNDWVIDSEGADKDNKM